MAILRPLTPEDIGEARRLILEAQSSLTVAIDALREYHKATGDEDVFLIIWTLEARRDQRSDCLGAKLNLDDILKRLYRPERLA